MIINSVQVTNFGILHNISISFDKNPYSFIQQNGTGKTTLASFIKAMFYGMEYSRSNDFTERQKYKPWQGGVYGGSLVFTANNKQYQISRTFGDKKKEDTFILYDAKSNKSSTDFDENIGMQLFGVDLDTYERSVFITLDKEPVRTDSVTAKLSDLVQDTNDVNNFENAYTTIDNIAKKLKAKKGKGGQIDQLQVQIDSDEESLRNIILKEKQSEQIQQVINKNLQTKKGLEAEQKILQEQFSANTNYNQRLHYEEMLKSKDAATKQIDSISNLFKGKIPSQTIINDIDLKFAEYQKYNTLAANMAITPTEEDEYNNLLSSFKGDVPTTEEITKCQKDISDYTTLQQTISEKRLNDAEAKQLELLEIKFAGKEISEEKIDECLNNIDTIQSLTNTINSLALQKQSAENALTAKQSIKPNNSKKIILIVLGILFAIAGGILFIKSILFGSIGFIIGIIILIIGLAIKTTKPDCTAEQEKVSSLENEIAVNSDKKSKLEQQNTNFISAIQPNDNSFARALGSIRSEYGSYIALKNKSNAYSEWLKSLTKKPGQFESDILSFTMRFGKSDCNQVALFINTLKDRLTKLQSYKEKKNLLAQNLQSLTGAEKMLQDALSEYQLNSNSSLANQVQECKDNKRSLEQTQEALQEIENRIAQFESTNDMSKIQQAQKPDNSTEQLDTQLQELNDKIEKLTESISKDRTEIDLLSNEIDRQQDLDNDKTRCLEDLQAKKIQYNILIKTNKYLEEAKMELEKKYMDPMQAGFSKYVKLLDDSVKFDITSDISVIIKNSGVNYSEEYFSAGYKDLANFCSRLALVDALFKNEKPTLLIDDPFVNLDSKKTKNALTLVKNIAKEKQVIYFTCHDSRVLTEY